MKVWLTAESLIISLLLFQPSGRAVGHTEQWEARSSNPSTSLQLLMKTLNLILICLTGNISQPWDWGDLRWGLFGLYGDLQIQPLTYLKQTQLDIKYKHRVCASTGFPHRQWSHVGSNWLFLQNNKFNITDYRCMCRCTVWDSCCSAVPTFWAQKDNVWHHLAITDPCLSLACSFILPQIGNIRCLTVWVKLQLLSSGGTAQRHKKIKEAALIY